MRTVIIVSTLALFSNCNLDGSTKKAAIQESAKSAAPNFELLVIVDSIPKKGFAKFDVPFFILNTSTDTLYLASTSCYGPCYYLEADTAKMKLSSLISCFASCPVIEEIAPHDTLTFTSCIQNINAVDSINIGFRFMNKREVNMENLSFKDIKGKSKVHWTTIKL